MPRPQKSQRNEMATVKIENAFWKLLETEKYADITVLRVSQEAGTNRNSFYYHYKNIDDLAYQALMHAANNDESNQLLSGLLSTILNGNAANEIDMSVLAHSKRIMLCARCDSHYLKQILHEVLRKKWFDSMSIKEALLSPIEQLQVSFIFAGLIAVLGRHEVKNCPVLMSTLSQTELGKAIMTTMKRISTMQGE